MLFSHGHRRRPGPKGHNKDLIEAVIAMKRCNPGWGCPRIAQQISLAFGVEIDKDVVRRALSRYYRPESDSGCKDALPEPAAGESVSFTWLPCGVRFGASTR